MRTMIVLLVATLLAGCAGAAEEVDDLSREAIARRDAGVEFAFDGSHGPCINCTR